MGKRRAEAFEFSGLYRSRAAFAAGEEGGDFGYNSTTAKVAELVDALDLGSSAERHVGSSPSFRTTVTLRKAPDPGSDPANPATTKPGSGPKENSMQQAVQNTPSSLERSLVVSVPVAQIEAEIAT